MNKTWIELLNDKVSMKMHDRLEILMEHEASHLDCEDVKEIHHIYEIFTMMKHFDHEE